MTMYMNTKYVHMTVEHVLTTEYAHDCNVHKATECVHECTYDCRKFL